MDSQLEVARAPTAATPLRWWEAVALTLLFALAPAVVLPMLELAYGKLFGLSLAQARLGVSQSPLAFTLVSLASLVAPLYLVRQRLPRPAWRDALGLHPVAPALVMVAVLTGLALQLPLAELSNVVEMFAPVSMEQKLALAKLLGGEGWLATLQLMLSLVVAAPVSEELMFRGVLLRGMRRLHRPALALGLSAALFGIAHAALVTAVIPAALAGALLGWLTLRCGSIVPAMAMHAAVNLVPVVVTQARLPIAGFNTLQAAVYHVPLPYLAPSCLLALLGLWWLRLNTNQESPSDETRTVP